MYPSFGVHFDVFFCVLSLNEKNAHLLCSCHGELVSSATNQTFFVLPLSLSPSRFYSLSLSSASEPSFCYFSYVVVATSTPHTLNTINEITTCAFLHLTTTTIEKRHMNMTQQLGQDCRAQDARLCQGTWEGQYHDHSLCPGQLRRVLWVWRKDRGPPNDHHPLHSLCQRWATGIHRKQRRTWGIGDSVTLNHQQPSSFLYCFVCFFAQCLFLAAHKYKQGIAKMNERKKNASRSTTTNKHIIDPHPITLLFSLLFLD